MPSVVDTKRIPRDGRRRVLAVDDEPATGRAIERTMGRFGFAIETCDDADEAFAIVAARAHEFDAILLDRHMPTGDGIALMRRILEHTPLLPVVMLTADDAPTSARAAMSAGAFSYLTKPWENEVLAATLESATKHGALARRASELEEAIGKPRLAESIVGTSDAIRKLKMMVERVAESEVGILVLGESGTGKELVARSIHAQSRRRDRPFVAVNCGAIPESLIDSELFGHVRGAFTGAHTERPGVFVEADGGTLFLDEIGEMPLQVQTRLLRVLQDGQVRALGASSSVQVDVRVVAATHVDLAKAVADGGFRADLYYRLNVVTTRVPALRQRLSDLPMLAAHFLSRHGGEPVPRLTPAAMDVLFEYNWPGNVRELENAIQHGLALGGSEIGVESLPATICTAVGARVSGAVQAIAAIGAIGTVGLGSSLSRTTDDSWFDDVPFAEAKKRAQLEFEQRYIERMLKRADGNITHAARLAGLDRSNFRRVMARAKVSASDDDQD